MYAALALAKRGFSVSIFERDGPPPDGGVDQAFVRWERPGAAQFLHPHAFLGLMCNLMQDNHPDLVEALISAGARRIGLVDMLFPDLLAHYKPEPGDEKLWMLLCRRATMEMVLRRYVEQTPQIEIINHCKVINIESAQTEAPVTVTGIQFIREGDESVFKADVVIDASGRTSKFPGWLKSKGAHVTEEKNDAKIVYHTRHYQLNAGVEEPPRSGKNRSAGDLGYLKYGVFPGENGHFAIILCLPIGEHSLKQAIRTGETFDNICRHIPGLRPWLDEGRMKATTEPFGIGDIQAVWRHFVINDKPLALNFFAIGDASIRTNPLYGRGCSISILHAHLLSQLLEDITDPAQRALEFDRLTEAEIRPIFKTSLSEDKSGIKRAKAVAEGRLLDKPDSLRKWFGVAFRDAISAASRQEIQVFRGGMRTFNLLEKPGAFLKDWGIRLIILRHMLKGRDKNVRTRLQRGPGREEMLELVDAYQPER